MSKAGDFEIQVSDPSPIWCSLSYRGNPLVMFNAGELDDLQYAVAKAIKEAAEKLEWLQSLRRKP